MKVVPSTRRSIVCDTPEGLEIVIPAKRNVFVLLFVSAWLVGWAMGEVMVVRQLLFGESAAPNLFLGAWLIMWTIAGGWAFHTLLWNAIGKEIVRLGPGVLATKHDVLGFGRMREFDLSHVKNLRVSPYVHDPFRWSASTRPWGSGNGVVAFDYGARTFRFGSSIDEAEGLQVIEELKARHLFGSAA